MRHLVADAVLLVVAVSSMDITVLGKALLICVSLIVFCNLKDRTMTEVLLR